MTWVSNHTLYETVDVSIIHFPNLWLTFINYSGFWIIFRFECLEVGQALIFSSEIVLIDVYVYKQCYPVVFITVCMQLRPYLDIKWNGEGLVLYKMPDPEGLHIDLLDKQPVTMENPMTKLWTGKLFGGYSRWRFDVWCQCDTCIHMLFNKIGSCKLRWLSKYTELHLGHHCNQRCYCTLEGPHIADVMLIAGCWCTFPTFLIQKSLIYRGISTADTW